MIQGFWADAAAHTGDQARFASEAVTLANLANASGGFYEIYNFRSGAPDGGWQGPTNHWGGLANQTWSATAYLRMMHDSMLGMSFTTGGITFAPTLPWGWGDVTLAGLKYRNATLNVTLHGAGNIVSSFKLDGATTANHSVSASLSGTHTVDITLTGGNPGAIHGYGNLCLDVRQGAATNGTPIQIWGCNGGTAQQWTVSAGNTLRSLGRCLDDPNSSTTSGTQVVIWDCSGGADQRWFLPA